MCQELTDITNIISLNFSNSLNNHMKEELLSFLFL